jgi:RNA polymerase sigma-70 factor (ECF subfamily)
MPSGANTRGLTVPQTENPRISQLVTHWTLLARAQRPDASNARDAAAELLPVYCAAIYNYVLGSLGDASAADEVCQEFALRFVRGDFRHAEPGRGRFRDYVKVAVIRLINEYRERWLTAGRVVPLDSQTPEPGQAPRREAALEGFWRQTVLNLAWAGLERFSDANGLLFHEVLWMKAEKPERRSADIAAELGRRHGRPFTAANARQLLHRAREKFSELLWRAVADSIPSEDPAEVEAELGELGLLAYFRADGPG